MKYRLIDTHCHPQFPQYEGDRDAVVRRALDAGIGLVCVGTDLQTSQLAIELATKYEGVYASVGLHPNDNLNEQYDQSEYDLLARNPKVVAIGEIGLDYYRTTDDVLKKKQRTRFIKQLDLVLQTNKPVIIHSRDAHDDMLDILHSFHGISGVIHSFNSTAAHARAYMDAGLFIGLNGIVTFSPEYSDIVKYIAEDRLILETDSPYLAPAPYRGKRNEPSYIDVLLNTIAEIRSVDSKFLGKITTDNALILYNSIVAL